MKKRISIMMLVLSLMLSAFVFADVDNTKVYGGALKEIGVIKGDQNGNLNGDDVLTREQSVATLVRLLGVNESIFRGTKSTFTDVPADNWSQSYIAYAKAKGLTKGVSKTEFGFGEKVTTQQYATFMLRALGHNGNDVYANAMDTAKELGLLQDVKAMKATDTVKRSDAFAMMYHTLEAKVKDGSTTLAAKLGKELPKMAMDSHYPVTISNFDNQKQVYNVTFDKAPEKVLCVYQDSIEVMLALGLEDHILQAYGLDQDVKPEWKAAFDKIDYRTEPFSPDKETVIAMQPDMILSWYSYFGDKKLGNVDYWNNNGIGTYMMRNSGADPTQSIENEYQDILNIGKIFNVEDKAEALVAEMKAEIANVVEKTKDMKTKPSVLVMEIGKKGIRVYGENTVGGDLVKAVGANMVAAPDNKMSAEDLVVANPDVIFSVYYGSSASLADGEKAVAKVTKDPRFASLKAVKDGKVLPMSLGEVYCPGPRTFDGIKTIAKGAYPELADAPKTDAKANAYYPVTIDNFDNQKQAYKVTFDKAPEKVLCVYQDSIETMLALGLEDHILQAYGLDQDVKDEYKAAFDKIDYRTEPFSPDKETVIAMQPDMILSWSSYFGDKKLGNVDYWNNNGIGTYMMRNSGAMKEKSIENEYQDILNIGKIFNVEDKAQALVDEMKSEIADVLEKTKDMKTKPKVLVMEVGKSGIRVYGENTVGGDLVKAVGAELVTAPDNKMSAEDLVVANPDVIFSVYYGSSKSLADGEKAVKKVIDDPKYASLKAVKDGKVLPMSLGEVYCPGTRTLDGIKTIVKGVYPELAK